MDPSIFGDLRSLAHHHPDTGAWTLLCERILEVTRQRDFRTTALPYLDQTLARWPDELRELPALWWHVYRQHLTTTREVQQHEGISIFGMMGKRQDHLELLRSIRLSGSSWSSTHELMELLRHCKKVTRLQLYGWPNLAARDVIHLRNLGALESMDLRLINWDPDDIRSSDTLHKHWPSLREVRVWALGTRGRMGRAIANTLEQGGLDLVEAPLDSPELVQALQASPPQHLIIKNQAGLLDLQRSVTLTSPIITIRQANDHETHSPLTNIAALPRVLHPELESLTLRDQHFPALPDAPLSATITSVLAAHQLPKLGKLDLFDCHHDQLDLRELAGLTALTHLDVGCVNLLGEDIFSERAEQLRALLRGTQREQWRALGLRGRLDVNELDARDAARMLSLPNLKSLDLGEIDPHQAGWLAELLSNLEIDALERFGWAGNILGEADARALVDAAKRWGLKLLDLHGYIEVSEEATRILLEGLPNTLVELDLSTNNAHISTEHFALALGLAQRAQLGFLGIHRADDTGFKDLLEPCPELPGLRALTTRETSTLPLDKLTGLREIHSPYMTALKPGEQPDNTYLINAFDAQQRWVAHRFIRQGCLIDRWER